MDRILYTKYKGPAGKKLRTSVSSVLPRPLFGAGKFLGRVFLLLVVLAAATGAYYAYKSLSAADSFLLKRVAVSGTKYVSKNEVLALARIETGRSLFQAGLEDAKERLQSNPQFESVAVNKVLPETVEITVKERFPAAFVGADRKFQISAAGFLFPSFKCQIVGKKLYVITGVKLCSADFGRKTGSKELQAALAMAALLESVKPAFLAEVSIIDVPETEELKLVTDDGRAFKIGEGNWDEKLEKLTLLLKSLNERCSKIDYVDMRFRDEAAVMFKK